MSFADDLNEVVSWEYPFPLGTRNARRRGHRPKDKDLQETLRSMQAKRQRLALQQLAERIASAKSLSGVCGRPSLNDWPVLWEEQSCRIFHPPGNGEVDDDYLGNYCLVGFINVSRIAGIHMLSPYFNTFHHIGDTPNDDDIATALTTIVDALPELPRYAVQYHHGKDEDISGSIAVPEPGKKYLIDTAMATETLSRLQHKEWPKSIRRNVPGFGTCLGATYNGEKSYIHPHTHNHTQFVQYVNSVISTTIADDTFI